MTRAHNFSAGPAALPLPVLESLQGVLTEFEDTQAGLMEISHRSKQFDHVAKTAESRCARFCKYPRTTRYFFFRGARVFSFT